MVKIPNLSNFFGAFFKISMFNLIMFFIFFISLRNGYLENIYSMDISYISLLITVLTFLFVVFTFYISYNIDNARLMLRNEKFENFNKKYIKYYIQDNVEYNTNYLYDNFLSKLLFLKEFSILTTTLGLLGTVIGFIIVLIFMDIELLKDFESMKKLFEHLSIGMGTALYTTLIGSVSSIWIYVDYILLKNELEKLCKEYLYSNLLRNNKENRQIVHS